MAGDPALQEKMVRLDSSLRQLQAIASVPLPVMAEQAAYERRQTLEFDRGSFLTPSGRTLPPTRRRCFPNFRPARPTTA